jgi:aminoglycoside phosphotransferase (APT) family kinase protein
MTRMSSAHKGIAHQGTGAEGRLADWLREAVRLEGALGWQQVAGGLSNVTCIVTDERGRRVVVRRPPDGKLAGGAHDVLREARIISALRPTAVPVPVVLATCSDPAVARAPFYVMEHADGAVVGSAAAARRFAVPSRRRLGFQLIDLLADLQAVDLGAASLSELRRNTPYLERQTRRWNAQWQATTERSVPAIDHVSRRLGEILPQLDPQPDCLLHGDFRFGNVMVVDDPAPRISALLDWELATTGHPLADLGFLGARMQAPDGVLEADKDPSSVGGFPAYDELARYFRERTGIGTDALPVFVALSAWRWAIIVEGIQKRFGRGQMGSARADAGWHRRRVSLLAEFAAGILG